MNRAARRAAAAQQKSSQLEAMRAHNPTATMPTRDDLTAVQRWQARRDRAVEKFLRGLLREGAL